MLFRSLAALNADANANAAVGPVRVAADALGAATDAAHKARAAAREAGAAAHEARADAREAGGGSVVSIFPFADLSYLADRVAHMQCSGIFKGKAIFQIPHHLVSPLLGHAHSSSHLCHHSGASRVVLGGYAHPFYHDKWVPVCVLDFQRLTQLDDTA